MMRGSLACALALVALNYGFAYLLEQYASPPGAIST
eukprot:SAG31_NODE_28442_length_410_cov_0.832797_1_plen_35_part_10